MTSLEVNILQNLLVNKVQVCNKGFIDLFFDFGSDDVLHELGLFCISVDLLCALFQFFGQQNIQVILHFTDQVFGIALNHLGPLFELQLLKK